ncbi:RNA polymerase sigma factor RpoD/SigA [Candidatus Latescibacterota bacterium]
MTTMTRGAARTDQLLELYWQEIKDNQPLKRSEEEELFGQARRGDEVAVQRIVEANLRFVLRVANEYVRPDGPPLIELVAEGNIGLMAAIKRFDETRGFKLITYAVWWIRQAIHRSLARQRRSARQPMNRLDDYKLIERRADALSQKLGRAPTFDEIIEASELSPERALTAVEAHQQDLSMDEPLYPDSDVTLHALYSADAETEEEYDHDALKHRLHECLALLDRRESLILRSYYGIGDSEPQTLEQIGAELSLTRERVRQLRNRALDKLRVEHAGQLVEWSLN